jgi:hypothetical protein
LEESYNKDNAIFGTEYKDINDEWHKPLIDEDLLGSYNDEYFSDVIYISS